MRNLKFKDAIFVGVHIRRSDFTRRKNGVLYINHIENVSNTKWILYAMKKMVQKLGGDYSSEAYCVYFMFSHF